MKALFVTSEVENHFRIGDHLRKTENCETEISGKESFDRGTYAEMKRCEGHVPEIGLPSPSLQVNGGRISEKPEPA